MIFGYQHPLDREYAPTMPLGVPDSGRDLPVIAPEQEKISPPELGVGIKDIGMSVPLGISAQNVQGVAAKIRSGVGNIELAFPGAVRGQRQQQTPEMYGLEQRRALRELAKANEINFTT